MLLAGVFGVLFGMGRLSPNPVIRWIATVVVEFFRSVPVLVMMFFTFYFVSYNFASETLPANTFPLVAVITGLTLYNGSVVAELIRSGVGSLPKGQTEAGLAIGLTRGQTLRTILLPQAITAMLPALVGQLVVVLKDTALGGATTAYQPTCRTQRRRARIHWIRALRLAPPLGLEPRTCRLTAGCSAN
jgi:glutamate transport system permease protein